MSRALRVFGGTLCIAAMIFLVVPVRPLVFWPLAVVVACVLVIVLGGAPAKLFRLPGSEFLCDRCKYNNARDCYRPERPNATRCPEFKVRGQ